MEWNIKYFGNKAPTKLRRDVRGNTDLYKICCDLYRPFYIYACHWIILSHTTSFVSWVFIWVIASLYPLRFFCISLTRFKEFRTFWPCSFIYPSVKGTDNFCKVHGLIYGFNELRRQITSGLEKRQMSQWVTYNFVPPLKEI